MCHIIQHIQNAFSALPILGTTSFCYVIIFFGLMFPKVPMLVFSNFLSAPRICSIASISECNNYTMQLLRYGGKVKVKSRFRERSLLSGTVIMLR